MLALPPASLPSNSVHPRTPYPPLPDQPRKTYGPRPGAPVNPDFDVPRNLPLSMAANQPSGAAGSPTKSNASKNGPRSAAAQSRRKQTGVLDQKALALEDEFKTKHLGVLGVLGWIM